MHPPDSRSSDAASRVTKPLANVAEATPSARVCQSQTERRTARHAVIAAALWEDNTIGGARTDPRMIGRGQCQKVEATTEG
jgi:hypothetical protein